MPRGPYKTHCKHGHEIAKVGRYGTTCAECFRKASKKRGKQTRAERRKFTQGIKLKRGCAICGYNENAVALTFHHTDPTTKKFNVSRASESGSMEKVLAEIEKCVVLCANCHLVLHHKEK